MLMRNNDIHNGSLVMGWPHNAQSRATLAGSILHHTDAHALTIAPTGAGKGVGVVIPNLLHYRGPIIVIDPKAENYFVTRRFREETLGQKVYLLDPFGEAARLAEGKAHIKPPVAARFNPLNLLRTRVGDLAEDEARREDDALMIADLLEPKTGESRNLLWTTQAKDLVAGLLFLIARGDLGDDASLRGLMNVLEHNDLAGDPGDRSGEESPGLVDRLINDEDLHPFARAQLNGFANIRTGYMRSDVLSYVRNYTAALRSKPVRDSLADETLDLDVIRDGKDFTIYIVIPPSKLESHRTLLRLYVGTLMTVIMERTIEPPMKTLFLLDECAQLGTLEHLRTAVTLLRGYGLKVWMFFQDLSQLQRLYEKDWKTMVANCSAVQTFGVSRAVGNNDLADCLGYQDPKEIFDLMSLHRKDQVVSLQGRGPQICARPEYYSDACFLKPERLFDDDPRRPAKLQKP
jgi:type IV secretion system protein VirD4